MWVNPAIEENVIRARYRKPGHSRPDAKDRAAMEAELKALEERRTAERHRQQRQTAIVMASLLFTGGEPNAVSITGFIDQQRIPYGSRFSVSPRIGVEAEMIKNWLMVRAGSYLEPSLFEDVPYRAHFTGGLDLKLFVFNPFGIFRAAIPGASASRPTVRRGTSTRPSRWGSTTDERGARARRARGIDEPAHVGAPLLEQGRLQRVAAQHA